MSIRRGTSDLLSADVVRTDPDRPTEAYLDLFGNRVTRVEAPPGQRSTLHNDFTIRDSGLPDETPEDRPLTPVTSCQRRSLPAREPLLRQRQLSDFAWSQFAGIGGGTSSYSRSATSCTIDIRFDYGARTAAHGLRRLREGVGSRRDFAHLAVALCRCMNIPARYCTGYLGDIGVPHRSGADGLFRLV